MALTYPVTGGLGFIGAILIGRLASPAGHICLPYNLNTGRLSGHAGLPVESVS